MARSESRISLEFNNLQDRFSGGENTEELIVSAKKLLPFICKRKVDCFKAEINCDLSTAAEIQTFIDNYKLLNDETLWAGTPTKPGDRSDYSLVNVLPLSSSNYSRSIVQSHGISDQRPIETLEEHRLSLFHVIQDFENSC